MQTKNLLVLSVMAIAYTLLWFALSALAGERIHDPLFQALLALCMIVLFTFSYTPLHAAVHMSVRGLLGGRAWLAAMAMSLLTALAVIVPPSRPSPAVTLVTVPPPPPESVAGAHAEPHTEAHTLNRNSITSPSATM